MSQSFCANFPSNHRFTYILGIVQYAQLIFNKIKKVNHSPERICESPGCHARGNLVWCGFELGFLYGSMECLDHPITAWLTSF